MVCWVSCARLTSKLNEEDDMKKQSLRKIALPCVLATCLAFPIAAYANFQTNVTPSKSTRWYSEPRSFYPEEGGFWKCGYWREAVRSSYYHSSRSHRATVTLNFRHNETPWIHPGHTAEAYLESINRATAHADRYYYDVK